MEIWFKNTESDSIRLPILPSSFVITDSHNNTSMNVHNVGEVNLLGRTNLLATELSSFWPNKEYPFCQYTGFISPKDFVKKIREWKRKNITPRLIITETDFNVQMSIESFQFGEEDATGDVKYSISLKEYKTVAYKKSVKKKKTMSYQVKEKDTLQKISKKLTGSTKYAATIYKQNKKVIEAAAKKHKRKSSKNGKYLYKGTKLVIKI